MFYCSKSPFLLHHFNLKMQVDTDNHPSFCKILSKEGCMDKILMPPDFVKENKKMLAKTCVLKTDVAGMLWKAKIVREKLDYFICEGEWPQFVVHHRLKLGDSLIFSLIDISTFHVMIFGKKSCKNFQLIEELSSSSEKEGEVVIGPPKSSKKVKMEPKESLAHGTHTIESDDSVEILEGIPISSGRKVKKSDMVENCVENIGHCPLRQSSKREREEDNAEADVSSVDIHIKRVEVEKSQEDIASHPFSRKGQKSSDGCKMQEQQYKIAYDWNQKVRDKVLSAAYQRANSYAFKSKNPLLVTFMQQSYVSEPYTLPIQLTFARKCFEENYSYLMLRVQGRGSWPVKCYRGTKKARITTGWKVFVLDNKLKCGDACVFEVIKGTDQLFIDVTIFREDGNTPNMC